MMPVEDVFSIKGRGTVVTGRAERGKIHTGDEVEIVGLRDTRKTVCTGVEMFHKTLDEGMAGDNCWSCCCVVSTGKMLSVVWLLPKPAVSPLIQSSWVRFTC